jgi:hypothetical protein
MKNITIRLPDVEAAMLVEVQKSKQDFKFIDKLIASLVRSQYQALFTTRPSK